MRQISDMQPGKGFDILSQQKLKDNELKIGLNLDLVACNHFFKA